MEPVNYELAYIDALLTAEDQAAMQRWLEVFELVLENWQHKRSHNLLWQTKALKLMPHRISTVEADAF